MNLMKNSQGYINLLPRVALVQSSSHFFIEFLLTTIMYAFIIVEGIIILP